jgi:hypothetical protein
MNVVLFTPIWDTTEPSLVEEFGPILALRLPIASYA